ncbi:MAG: prepilin-type N-terminal cleavage/methylation domain-containing protein [Verrucomicrobiales bacterium]|nr:prepilin-type N-terminal cleavage/methylation domain-containing protein [Verrucomicrobiales bacterium]
MTMRAGSDMALHRFARPAPRPPAGSPRGFTLLEVMIVIGIAAMVMAIGIPFVQRTIRRDAVYQAVHIVEEACRNARATAIFKNATTEVVIHPKDKSFGVQAGRNATGSPPPTRSNGEPGADKTSFLGHAPKPFSGQLADDVAIEFLDVNFTDFKNEEEARIQFRPNGTSDEFTIVLRIGSLAWRKITLEVVTGLPTLEIIR